jgi:hypothetical protein
MLNRSTTLSPQPKKIMMTGVPTKRLGIPTKFTGTLGTAGAISYDLSRGYPRISNLEMAYSITRAAQGAAGAANAPLVTDSLGDIILRNGDKNLRVRSAAQMFGPTGLLAKEDAALGGHVVYTQNNILLNLGVPVRIGSAADAALKNALANLATTATFYLNMPFVEYFRKEYATAEMFALFTMDVAGRSLGEFTLDIYTNNQPGAVASTGQALRLTVEHDRNGYVPGEPYNMIKESRFLPTYSGVGEVELASQIDQSAGVLDSVSLLTEDGLNLQTEDGQNILIE